jgi:3-oxoacyl-[acyl-carrier-protein] synthase-3
MAIFSIPNVKIAGVSACVPKKEVSNYDYNWVSMKERKALVKTTGVETKRMAEKGTTTSDLCYPAAEKLIEELKWDKNDIELLVFISQSRDYLLPQTAGILQDKLGLPKTAMAMDIPLGCSAFVYGLSVVGSLMMTGAIKKGLLLMGDISSIGSYRDKSTYPLFGDAGTATALEFSEGFPNMDFNLQTDGSGYDALIIPHGGFRNFANRDSFNYKKYGKGIHRTKFHVQLDGIRIFNFSITEVAPNIKKLLKKTERDIESFDYFIFHQANYLMNETIRRQLKQPREKFPYSIHKYGNTSSATIPLTMVTELRNQLTKDELDLVFSGFGVGLSWGTVFAKTKGVVVPDILEYEKS